MAALENSWICAGSPTSTRCVVTLRVPGLADLGGELLQPGLVAVGEREVAAACGQLQRERAADAAGGAGHGGRASGYRSHVGELLAGRERAGSRKVSQIGTEP